MLTMNDCINIGAGSSLLAWEHWSWIKLTGEHWSWITLTDRGTLELDQAYWQGNIGAGSSILTGEHWSWITLTDRGTLELDQADRGTLELDHAYWQGNIGAGSRWWWNIGDGSRLLTWEQGHKLVWTLTLRQISRSLTYDLSVCSNSAIINLEEKNIH